MNDVEQLSESEISYLLQKIHDETPSRIPDVPEDDA